LGVAIEPAAAPHAAQGALEALRSFGPIHCIKLYRLSLSSPPAVPIIPCLDHEAMMHQRVAPHMAVYLQDQASGDLHEAVFVPAKGHIEVDTVSTWGECSPESHARLLAMLAAEFPNYRVTVGRPSWWRGGRRVAEVCRAQVTLRDVLLADNLDAVRTAVERLQTIGTLMEKQSRVASWGVRTVTGPVLTAAAVIAFLVLGVFTERLTAAGVTALRYILVGLIGATFLYYGLKAVQLTEMANRVWKRSAEYNLILAERRRNRA
jgi:hypothetical protein